MGLNMITIYLFTASRHSLVYQIGKAKQKNSDISMISIISIGLNCPVRIRLLFSQAEIILSHSSCAMDDHAKLSHNDITANKLLSKCGWRETRACKPLWLATI